MMMMMMMMMMMTMTMTMPMTMTMTMMMMMMMMMMLMHVSQHFIFVSVHFAEEIANTPAITLSVCFVLSTWSGHFLGGGIKYLLFSPLPGEMINLTNIFSNGLKPPTSY